MIDLQNKTVRSRKLEPKFEQQTDYIPCFMSTFSAVSVEHYCLIYSCLTLTHIFAFKYYFSVLLTNFIDGEGAYDMERELRCREGAYAYANSRYSYTYIAKEP